MRARAPYGSWASPITTELITAGIVGLGSLSSNGTSLFWLESRPSEGGRVVLIESRDGVRRELTPAPFNVRSRVHEYGGGAYLATARFVVFVNFKDQDLYRIDLARGGIERITESPDSVRYADFCWDDGTRRLFAVEQRPGAEEEENLLVAIDLDARVVDAVHRGHDFYAAPRVSPDGRHLAFLTWDHPNMPWDGTELHRARIGAGGALTDDTVIAGGAAESIAEPFWLRGAPGAQSSSDRLVFASDRTGYWNLYSFDESGLYCIHEDAAEYAGPQWSFGPKSVAALSPTHLLCRRIEDGVCSLLILDVERGFATPWRTEHATFDDLTAHEGKVYALAGGPDRLPAVVALDPTRQSETVIHASGDVAKYAPYFTAPEPIRYPTRDGAHAYAYFYPPLNPDFEAPSAAPPPLVVMSHGGPTSAASANLNLRVQYYTSRGWAVLDVNYGGSTGFGRAYRARLDGQWGVVDVADCEDGVRHLARERRIDPERVAIRGGSAGGFTTLASLTFATSFRAGASWYGIGDLELLARDTHKFESRYLDRLVGPYPEQQALYRERSPIHHVDRFNSGVIFLQGLEDRVVPPNQAETMVEALRAKRLPVAYVAFEHEGHGFRDAANIRRAMEAEHAFFAKLFGFEPADNLAALAVENWP